MKIEQDLTSKLAIARTQAKADSLALCEPLQQLAVHHCNRRKLDLALPLIQELWELQCRGIGASHSVTIASLSWLASTLAVVGQLDRAERLLTAFVHESASNSNVPLEQQTKLQNQLVELLYQRSRLGEACETCQRVIGLLGQEDKSNESLQRQLQRARNNMGALQVAMGEYRIAQRYFVQNLRDAERTLPAGDPVRTTQLSNLASLLRLRGRLKKSEQLTIQAVRECQRANGWYHPLVAQGLSNLGSYRLSTGRPKSAEALFRKALRIHRKLHPSTHIQMCRTSRQLAEAQLACGRVSAAERGLERVRSVLEQQHSSDKPQLALTLCSLGLVYLAAGRIANAERLLNQAIEIQEQSLGSENSQLVPTLNALGRLNSARGNLSAAMTCHQRAMEITEARLGSEHPDVAATLIDIADVQRRLSNIDQARNASDRALKLRESKLRFRPVLVAQALICSGQVALADRQPSRALSLGAKAKRLCSRAKECPATAMADISGVAAEASRQLNRHRGAEELSLQELAIREQATGLDHASLLPVLKRLARIYVERDLFVDAQQLFRRALAIAEKALGALHEESIYLTEELGRVSVSLRDFDEATRWMDRTIKTCQRCFGDDAEQVALTLLKFSDCLRLADRISEADAYERRAIELRNRNCHVLL